MITLTEELVLLGIEDDGKIAYTAGTIGFGLAVIGACLVGLSNAGRIDADLDAIRVISTEPVGTPAEDRVLAELAAGPSRGIEEWVLKLQPISQELVGRTLGLLVKRGILERNESSFLWVLKSRRYPVIEGRERKEAKPRSLSTLLTEDLPTSHDTVMLGLADAAQLLPGFLSSAEIARLESRMALVGGIDLFVRGVEAAIRTNAEINAKSIMMPVY